MNHFSWLRVHFILICINYVSSSSYSIKWLHISLLHHTFGLTAHTYTHHTSGERNRGSKCSSISNGNHTIMRRIHTWASVKQQHFHHLIWFDLRFRFSLFAFICNFLWFFREHVKKSALHRFGLLQFRAFIHTQAACYAFYPCREYLYVSMHAADSVLL